ncbi:FecR family protein [Chitinophaga rhizophila]|uniref:FecR domain-containing protein n=1 Tax=Chitinophaga rhizophila TaxID=2866212 RepID=A0ABS7GK88_9BACT|nr:FecR domain-containing protein [Chitinophaga rhizophila]MBW8688136.1 FecR domain-containing protein [Chitinophaga rhizophila]
MDKGTLLLLLEKFRQGVCSPEEEALLYKWMDALEADDTLPALSANEMAQYKRNMQHHIWPAPISRYRRIGLKLTRVAAVIIPLAVTGYFAQRYVSRGHQLPHTTIVWQTVTNNSGQLKKITLPDQSVAIAGPYSTIQFPAHFPDDARPIKITEGKAFFDVVKDTRPFSVVDNSGVRTTVLGTSFTIEASNNLHISRIAVATGKVQVAREGATTAVLGPSQRLTFREQSIEKDSVATADILAWTNGKIVLRNATLQELLLTIQHQYGITATTTLDVNQGNYNLHIPASMTLQEVLEVVERISYKPKIHFTMDKGQVHVESKHQ